MTKGRDAARQRKGEDWERPPAGSTQAPSTVWSPHPSSPGLCSPLLGRDPLWGRSPEPPAPRAGGLALASTLAPPLIGPYRGSQLPAAPRYHTRRLRLGTCRAPTAAPLLPRRSSHRAWYRRLGLILCPLHTLPRIFWPWRMESIRINEHRHLANLFYSREGLPGPRWSQQGLHTSSRRASAWRCWWVIQPRHGRTPVHLASHPHPPTALAPASLSSPPGSRQRSGEMLRLAGSVQARRLFYPVCPNPGHRHLRAHPWTGSSPRSKGVLGVSAPCSRHAKSPTERGHPAPPATLTLPRGCFLWQRPTRQSQAAPGEAREGPRAGGTRHGGHGVQPAPGCSPLGKGPRKRGPPSARSPP